MLLIPRVVLMITSFHSIQLFIFLLEVYVNFKFHTIRCHLLCRRCFVNIFSRLIKEVSAHQTHLLVNTEIRRQQGGFSNAK